MRQILGFIVAYWREVNKLSLSLLCFFMAVLIWLNYGEQLEFYLVEKVNFPRGNFTGHFVLYSIAFFIPSLVILPPLKSRLDNGYYLCLIAAPLIFALKVSLPSDLFQTGNPAFNTYWNHVIYWPVRLIIILTSLYLLWMAFDRDQPFYGLKRKGFKASPYFWMLLIMVPLIIIASTQPDFLATYPKLKRIMPLPSFASPSWLYYSFFEVGYGTDFLSIEIFFRGFLILGFIKWLGKDAILPMACFYCSIHFGKPLGECISSFFGGMLLGIVSYNTRSIYGGLIVHLGIAWLMEAGGLVGNAVFK